MDRKMRGVTIMEVLVVLSILAVMAGFGINYLLNYISTQNLRRGADMVVSLLEEARRMSSTRPQMHGIRVTAGERRVDMYTVGNNCGFGALVQSFELPNGVVFEDDSLVTYDRMGYPRNDDCGLGMGRITLRAQRTGETRSICINRYGRIRVVEGSQCS